MMTQRALIDLKGGLCTVYQQVRGEMAPVALLKPTSLALVGWTKQIPDSAVT